MSTLVKNTTLKIKTPMGFESFFGMQKIIRNKYIHLKFLNGKELKCSENHPLITSDGVIKAKDLRKTEEIITDGIGTFVVSKRTIIKKVELFDIVNSGEKNIYFTNNILSHNCDFLGSQETLISAATISTLAHEEPIETQEHLKVYAKPQSGRKYLLTADVAEGVEEDASAFVVFDITQIPYTIAAVYANNTIAPMIFPSVIEKIAKIYNTAFVCIELNARGSQVADILHHDLEYPNLLLTAMRGRNGLLLGQGFSNKCKFGLVVNISIKKLGCSNLKSLIETYRLIITDFQMISEFTTYIVKGNSYGADHGSHDDLVSCCVIFAWISTQPYFREITDLNTVQSVVDNSETIDEYEILGGIDIAGVNESFVDGDLLWKTDSENLYEYGDTLALWDFV